jgi:NTP pyrophosphatase (non-canonical NTP hydrolase)
MTNPIARIMAERQRQIERWGEEHDPGDGILLAVLAEEVGEVGRALCHHWPGPVHDHELEAELVQVAAVCVAWLQAIERRRKDDPFSEQ